MKKTISIIAILVVCLLVATLCLTACNREYELAIDGDLQANIIDDNYRTFYEIFVGGFSDGNGDGVGDLRGLINRLDYLNDGDPNSGKSLGINGIWLMPIMPSRSYHKYDVANYMAIDKSYGTLDDMKELVDECNKRDIKLIIDLVLNHTSLSHNWFVQARQAISKGETDSPYYNYYCKSTTQSSGWYYFATDPSGQKWYYEGNFSSEMPELNYDSPYVRDEIEDIVKFWLADMKIDGFRLDAVRYIYYNNNAANIEFLKWFRETCQKYKSDVYIVGEDWNNTGEELQYYTAVDVFNFGIGTNIMDALFASEINEFANSLENYYNSAMAARDDAILQPFLSNHDQDRIANHSYFMGRQNGNRIFYRDRYKMAANMYILSPGSPFIYYGEEIGMMGSRDDSANTDANRRLAMLWGDKDTVSDPVGSTYKAEKQLNGTVKSQLKDSESIYNHYKLLIAIRNANPEIARGKVSVVKGVTTDSTVCILKFTYNGSTVYVIHNIGFTSVTLDLSALGVSTLRAIAGEGGGALSGNSLSLGAQTSAVIK